MPLIVGFVADLMFLSKIESVAERLNFRVRWIERAEQIAAPEEEDVPPRQPAEHLVGPGAVLIDLLTQWRPALVLFDLSNTEIPWREWLPLLKSAPATRRIPVVCYGSHVDVDTLKDARSRGADAVLARSRFASDLPNILQNHARTTDWEALAQTCQAPLSDLAIRGLEEFNRGAYFEAHEWLEEAWNKDLTPGRELYRAVLQVAVAYLQIERGNYNGALKMFLRLRQWIEPLPGVCRGIQVEKLRADAARVHAALLELGPDRLQEFDRRLFQPVKYHVGTER